MQLSIHKKIILFIVLPMFLIFSAILGYGLLRFQERAQEQGQSGMMEMTYRYASQLNAHLAEIGEVAIMTAQFLEIAPDLSLEQIYAQLRNNVTNNPLIYGSAVAFEPGTVAGRRLFAPYVHRSGDGIEQLDISIDGYDYTDPRWQWWHGPRSTKAPFWSDPYFDEGAGDILMVTYSVPFFRQGRFAGVATVDVDISVLNKLVGISRPLKHKFVILTGSGHFVFHFDADMGGRSYQTLARSDERTQWVHLAELMMTGASGMVNIPAWRSDAIIWVFYAPAPFAHWSLAAMIPEDEALAFSRRQMIERVVMTGVGLLVIMVMAWRVTRRITRPIATLTASARKIAEGNLDVWIDTRSRDEVGVLARTFEEMAEKLAAREQALRRLNNELEARVEARTAELHESRRIIEEAKRRLQEITDTIPSVVYQFRLDADGKPSFSFMSDGIRELFGTDRQSALERSAVIDRLVLDEDKSALDASLQRSAQTLTPWHHEFRIRRQGGVEKWIRGAATPFKEPDDTVLWNGYWIDVSDQKAMQGELARAKEAAEAANRAKSDFLANMSHEIRTPMNAIIGLSHLVLGTKLAPKQCDYLTKIHGSAQALLGIINDILDFSKIEAGKFTIDRVEFDLDEVLGNLSDIIGLKATEKGLEFLIDMEPDLPVSLVGDPLRLGQVLINLANNAVKFTEEGEITVRISLLERGEERVALRFDVTDTGIGLTEEQAGKLFQPFTQADGSSARKYGGTGLGLTISKHLVEMMDGGIGLETKPGEGSTFFFTAAFGIGRKNGLYHRLGLPPDLVGMRVLVVDDNPTSREILARYLESFGCQVGEAASGEEALADLLAAVPERAYRLVLMDWKLGGMDGIEATRRIKSSDSLRPRPAVIMVSAYGRDELIRQTEEVGLDGCLIKPINQSTLHDAIIQAFGDRSPSQPEPAHITTPVVDKAIRGAHLLLVEDNAINQLVAQELLEKVGFVVTIANDGRESIDAVQRQAFDGVLMDIQMPVMDGLEATRRIRADARFKDLPIIAMTANAMAGDREKSIAAGMNDHVAKPIDLDELFATLNRWIRVNKKAAAGLGKVEPERRHSVIDMDAGLQRVKGNVELYHKILDRFRATQEGIPARVRQALEAGEEETAARVVHALKNVAGNIGAFELCAAVGRLETALKERDEDPRGSLESVGVALARVFAAIDERRNDVTARTAAEKPETLDRAALASLFNRLRTLLKDNDTAASDTLEAIAAQLRGTEHKSVLSRLAELVGRYDFENALSEVAVVARILNLSVASGENETTPSSRQP